MKRLAGLLAVLAALCFLPFCPAQAAELPVYGDEWRVLALARTDELTAAQKKSYSESVEAALRIVDALTEQGYWFVTVEELLELNGIAPQPGTLYRSGRA